QVSRLRPDRPAVGADRGPNRKAARSGGPRGRRPAAACFDIGAEQVPRAGDGRPYSDQQDKAGRPDSLWRPGGRAAAVVCAVHERRVGAALLLRALPHEQASRGIWIRGNADTAHHSASAEGGAELKSEVKSEVKSQKSKGKSEVGSREQAARCYTSGGSNVPAAATLPRGTYKAPEVCEMVGVPHYVLRSWETEFPDLGISKTADGPRVYRQAD